MRWCTLWDMASEIYSLHQSTTRMEEARNSHRMSFDLRIRNLSDKQKLNIWSSSMHHKWAHSRLARLVSHRTWTCLLQWLRTRATLSSIKLMEHPSSKFSSRPLLILPRPAFYKSWSRGRGTWPRYSTSKMSLARCHRLEDSQRNLNIRIDSHSKKEPQLLPPWDSNTLPKSLPWARKDHHKDLKWATTGRELMAVMGIWASEGSKAHHQKWEECTSWTVIMLQPSQRIISLQSTRSSVRVPFLIRSLPWQRNMQGWRDINTWSTEMEQKVLTIRMAARRSKAPPIGAPYPSVSIESQPAQRRVPWRWRRLTLCSQVL